jgi:undecaprenyl-diphosphatase
MELLNAIILGIIEGLTEFLPISSTGHLLLAEKVLGVDADEPHWKIFLFVCQLGAILAVVVYFWRDLWQRIFDPPTRAWRDHILTKLIAAMIPTVLIGLALNRFMERYLETPAYAPLVVAAALILGAGLMEWIDRRFRRNVPQSLENVTLRQAALVGVIQCVSMWPGISRAGASIMGGMALGLTPAVATQFSFYLAIPTMLAASVKRLWDYRHDLSADHAVIIIAGTATAFVVALVVVATFMSYVKRYRFTPFAVYRVLLGIAVIWAYFAR